MNKNELMKILNQIESQNIEFKPKFSDEVIKSLVAFSNANGGNVLIGIDDDGKILGCNINKETIQHWINEIKTKTFHDLIPKLCLENAENENIVIANVLEHPLKPISFKGRYYIRKQNSNHLMNATEIADEVNKTLNTSFDAYAPEDYSIGDLNLDEIKYAIDIINKRKEIKISSNANEFLTKYNLISNNKPTLAALLLFCDRFSHKRTVQIGVFQSNLIIKDEFITSNYLIRQADEILEFVKKHINKMTFIVDQPRNIQKWEYPLEALRELIINLVVHRDYRQTATIKIFEDEIVFSNYGGLPSGYTVDDFILGKRSSYLRNKLIAKIFRECSIIEEYSSGLKRAVKLFRKNGNKEFEFLVDENNFTVKAFSLNKDIEKGVEKLSKNQQIILNLISKNSRISKEQIRIEGELTKKTVEYNIVSLKKKGLLKRVGANKGGYWKIIE